MSKIVESVCGLDYIEVITIFNGSNDLGDQDMDTLVRRLRDAEQILTVSGHSKSEYMLAVDEISDVYREMSGDYCRYLRTIEKSFVTLQVSAFDKINFDEPIIELAKVVPVSFYLCHHLLKAQPPRIEAAAAILESFSRQILHLNKYEDGKQLAETVRLLDASGMHEEIKNFLQVLISAEDGSYENEIAEAFDNCLYAVAAGEYPAAKDFFLAKSAEILDKPWAGLLGRNWNMEFSLNLYHSELAALGVKTIINGMPTALGRNLLEVESIAGISVSNETASEMIKRRGSSSLLEYALRSTCMKIDPIVFRAPVYTYEVLSDSLAMDIDKYPLRDENYSDIVENVLMGVTDAPQFFLMYQDCVIDRPVRIKDGFHQRVLSERLNGCRNDLGHMAEIFSFALENKISFDHSAEQKMVDETLLTSFDRMTTYTIIRTVEKDKEFFWVPFSEDVKVAALTRLAEQGGEFLKERFLSLIPHDLVMKIPAMKRALLVVDMGLD